MSTKQQFFGAFITTLLLLSSAQAAQIYKTKDKNGNVSYSSTAPVKGDYQIVGKTKTAKANPEAEKQAQAAGEQLLKDGEQNPAAGSSDAKTAEFNKQMQAYCKSLTERLQVIQNNAYVKVKNDKGEVSMLGDDARKAEISSLQGKISKDCK